MGCKRFRAKKRKRVKFRGNQFTQKAVNKEDADRTNEGTPPCQTSSRPRPVLPQEDNNRNWNQLTTSTGCLTTSSLI